MSKLNPHGPGSMELIAATATGGPVKSGAVADSAVIADTSAELKLKTPTAARSWGADLTAGESSPVREAELKGVR